jgi:dihydrofolate reductase
MRRVILGVAVTLDGLIEGPNGEYDWCFTDQDYGMTPFLKSIDAIFYGRKSFEMMLKADETGGSMFGGKTNYVFSNTLKSDGKDFQLVSGDIESEVKKIKAIPGKDIWLFGGASLLSSLLNAGLVDELWLSVHPILLGKGKPLFSDIEKRVALKLIESKTYDSGLVSIRYSIEY